MKAKKSLGQNFLTSKDVVKDIVSTADISSGDVILEVGPGRGFLTEELLKNAKKVIAIEKDDGLVEYLKGKFSKEIKEGRLVLAHDDILNLDFNKLGNKRDPISFIDVGYKVVANIPYYITGQLLRMFLESETQPERMVLMLQKEVAERIVSIDGKESILSMSVKAYGEPSISRIVGAEYFNPKPKVDSAILLIQNISKKHFSGTNSEKEFFKLIKQGFLHKRKTLLGNLKIGQPGMLPVCSRAKRLNTNSSPLGLTDFEEIFNTCNIPLKTRAEKLSGKDWLCLQNKLN